MFSFYFGISYGVLLLIAVWFRNRAWAVLIINRATNNINNTDNKQILHLGLHTSLSK